MRYEGKAVLVTGGATGIGRATALAFAKACKNTEFAALLKSQRQM